MKDTSPGILPPQAPEDLTDLLDRWQGHPQLWKSQVRRTLRLHLQQEHMMQTVHSLHFEAFRVLQDAGYELMPDPCQADVRLAEHKCHCGRTFTTPQGLATHKWKKHRQHAPEYHLITGSTCQACLKYFWTSARLYQHLAYAPRNGGPNRCYEILRQMGMHLDRDSAKMHREADGPNRREAQQTFGPHRLFETTNQKALETAERHLTEARQRLQEHLTTPQGSHEQAQQLKADLTEMTWKWFHHFKEVGSDRQEAGNPADLWIDHLASFPEELHPWAEEQFTTWGKYQLEEIIENLVDGEAEFILEEVYGDIAHELPGQALRAAVRLQRIAVERLTRELAEDDHLAPHRPVRLGTANEAERKVTKEQVLRRIGAQPEWEANIRRAEWFTFPTDPKVPRGLPLDPWTNERHFCIVRLFSGRRRPGDLHDHLDALAAVAGIKLTVLSLDTAVSSHYCNLDHRQAPWQHILAAYRQGCVTATVAGPPCETYSQARHTTLEGVTPNKGPRPVRSAEAIYGLEGLRPKEYKQVAMGSFFFLQTMITFAYQVACGGFYIGEHPARPDDPTRASIWRAAITEFFLKNPDAVLHTLPQWIWGASAIKPTGLLTLRLPHFRKVMFAHRTPNAVKPQTLAIGKHADGSFRTSSHKEYPSDLSKAFAAVLLDAITLARREGRCNDAAPSLPLETIEWLTEVQKAGSQIRTTAQWLPDFQG